MAFLINSTLMVIHMFQHKFWPCFLFLIASKMLLAQTQVVWSDSLVVTSTNLPVTAPRIAFLPNGAPIISWGTSSNNNSQIWCAALENGSFNPAVAVVQAPNQPVLFGFGGYDMAVFEEEIHIVYEQLQSGIWYAKSTDGGLTFGPGVLVQGPVTGGFATIASIATDGLGNPIISYIRDKNGAVYEVRQSADGGSSFGDPVIANLPAPGGEVCECCSSDLLVSGDSVWIVFRNNNQNLRDIWVSRSTNHAASFDLATDVDETDWQINTCPISGPRMTRSGDSIATVWMSQATGLAKVYASTLHAGAMSSGNQVAFPTSLGNLVNQTFPDITASGDTIGVVFLEKAKEVVFFHSVNGITGLEQAEQRFAVPNHTLQWPTIAFRNGVFHLAYADAAADKIFYRTGVLTAATAVSTPALDHTIKVFPNPATGGRFQVYSADIDMERVSIFNHLGQLVYAWNGLSNRLEVALHHSMPGLYNIQISSVQGHFYRSVILD
ncbi:MAG: T9SS type A sorting domain-containing protein [Saprospiraceae bacterium]|nr:T9SS type A sorting domain-containing protein [Saprospiraceae bacterium]